MVPAISNSDPYHDPKKLIKHDPKTDTPPNKLIKHDFLQCCPCHFGNFIKLIRHATSMQLRCNFDATLDATSMKLRSRSQSRPLPFEGFGIGFALGRNNSDSPASSSGIAG